MRDLLAFLKNSVVLLKAGRDHVLMGDMARAARSRAVLSVVAGAVVAVSVLVIFQVFGGEEAAPPASQARPVTSSPPAPPRGPMASLEPVRPPSSAPGASPVPTAP
ncbi:hypothetical protein C1I98_32525, partial [Spongiactinospora gelatinilytica]